MFCATHTRYFNIIFFLKKSKYFGKNTTYKTALYKTVQKLPISKNKYINKYKNTLHLDSPFQPETKYMYSFIFNKASVFRAIMQLKKIINRKHILFLWQPISNYIQKYSSF